MEDTRKFYWWSIRREEEEFILGRGPRTDFDPLLNYAVDDPVPQGSCPTVDEVLTKAQFLSPLLYQIHCIGPVGFGFAHIYSERHPRPNWDPTIGTVCWKNLHASENDNGQPTGPQMENYREVPSSAGVWRHVRGPRPH